VVLSNRSTDWWKTLQVWGDLLQKKQWDPLRTRLALLTTSTTAPGSTPSLLRDDDRDPAEALKQLVALAATAPSQALEAPVQMFDALTALPQSRQQRRQPGSGGQHHRQEYTVVSSTCRVKA
jgi:hypothetical protein